ncbi:hypothetical protein EV580_3247 [Mycobacterium sp. BK086]|uniref:hypothetical protein n=1 Tax=Mycobacterium sp. BK086 TaxID=2512165 RepID=UPI00105CD44B|nr:hypothetical protein [Mycobacterium sp. BK086]TDO15106.1 hypothetical protein EV580_3247 [Mycobacterium sp. BK086]
MLTRFRMDLVSETVADAVEHAGGLICDRSLTGWDVRVFAVHDDAECELSLRILGATRAEGLSPDPAADTLLRSVLVSDSLYRTDDAIKRWVDKAIDNPSIEVLAWDAGRPNARGVEIPVSRATRFFLDQARTAAGLESVAITSELLCQWRTGRMRQAPRRQHILTTASEG